MCVCVGGDELSDTGLTPEASSGLTYISSRFPPFACMVLQISATLPCHLQHHITKLWDYREICLTFQTKPLSSVKSGNTPHTLRAPHFPDVKQNDSDVKTD